MPSSQIPNLGDDVFLRCVEDCFEPIMLTNQSGLLSYVNPAWVQTYGYSKEEAYGKTPRLLRSPHQGDDFYQKMWKTIVDPKIGFWRGEVVNKAKDGHLVPVLLTITPYRKSSAGGANPEILGYMGIAVDLTDRREMEKQILRQDRLASIGLLAGGLAHEIGNPLGVIRGRAELLMNQVKGNEPAAKNLDIIIGQIDRISGLIQSLLRVSRIPDQILMRQVGLKPILEDVAVLMGEACRQAGVEIKLANTDQMFLAEPNRMQQLLLNIMINSLHAIEDKKQKLPSAQDKNYIEISSEIAGDFCYIRITDTGCGISQVNLEKIFQPFFTTKAAGKGTGLGLAIVAKLVEEMGAQISVKSDGPGKGACFSLKFRAR